MKKTQAFDYHTLKKALAPYFKFSFKAPPKNRQFKPQQKSALVRAYNKISQYFNENLELNLKEVTFLKYPEKPKRSKLPHIDGVRTNKGLIYKWPQASLKQLRDSNKWVVVVNPKIKKGTKLVQKRRDIFFPFPPKIIHDINLIEIFVNKLIQKYRPHGVQWAYRDTRSRVIFDAEKLNLYISTDNDDEFSEIRELVDFVVKRYKNLLSDNKLSFKKAVDKFVNSDTYAMMDPVQRNDFWAALNFKKNVRRDDFNYNGVFFIYYL